MRGHALQRSAPERAAGCAQQIGEASALWRMDGACQGDAGEGACGHGRWLAGSGAFGGGGGGGGNVGGIGGVSKELTLGPAEKAIVYNELVTNAVALRNVVDQTQALHTLKSKGVSIRPADLAFLIPYATSKLKRFGDYPTNLEPEAMPTRTTIPV